MDAHGVHIFNGADDNDIVVFIPHDLQFVFFPAQDRFFEHDLSDQAGIKSGLSQFFQFFGVIGHAAARAAEGETGTKDDGESDILGDSSHFFQMSGKSAFGDSKPDIFHGVSKKFTAFGLLDRFDGCADHFDPEFIQDAHLGNFYGGIEAGLAAQGRQQGARLFFFNDFGNGRRHHRFNIGTVRHFRIGHNSRRVTVDKYDLVTFLL
jgi:hypothetical protein